jgi:hypothetical protein
VRVMDGAQQLPETALRVSDTLYHPLGIFIAQSISSRSGLYSNSDNFVVHATSPSASC